ncbi:tRNA pseudouridine(55) synthase TruB [Prochlorococcus sp. MIT 1300]|uniref:tRNA pseudouridine(55) synthase TruB n=1 Tax=Prochlorococcus sp. MIT 1300 TaxID=3096218 RepID=UPI002A75FE06|nr:tRNA pseudouridine(55) synthase TruB [Prochlorococcus sp. MIT 1300]
MENPFGFIVIDKPSGITSHDCVNQIRRIFGTRRVGHGGTLDPTVTGVLPIAIGYATRLLPYLQSDKNYQGVIQLGTRTNTDDLNGEVLLNKSWPKLAESSLEKYLEAFRGQIEQSPPQVSSVHIKGERAYIRARRGEKVTIPPKPVTIFDLKLLYWNANLGQLKISVHCSKGTYIRSIARDLGEAIGCGACLATLRRTQALGFLEEHAFQLNLNEESVLTKAPPIISPKEALQHLQRLELTEKEDALWQTGSRLYPNSDRYKVSIKSSLKTNNPCILVIDSNGHVAGIGLQIGEDTLQPKVVFNAKG